MANPIARLEVNDTKRFFVTYSAVPGTTPNFALRVTSAETLVWSRAATATSSYAFETYFTLPNSQMFYQVTWTVSFTNGAKVLRDLFQAIRTTPSG